MKSKSVLVLLVMLMTTTTFAKDLLLTPGQSTSISISGLDTINIKCGHRTTPPSSDICIELRNLMADHNYESVYELGRQGIQRCRIINNNGYMGVVKDGYQISKTTEGREVVTKDLTDLICSYQCI